MKKHLLLTIICSALLVLMLAGCGQQQPPTPAPAAPAEPAPAAPAEPAPVPDPPAEGDQPFRVGITLQSLQNPYWAGVFGHVETILNEKGWDFTILDSNDSAAVQIGQIENFIVAGKELIMIHPSDPHAIEDAARQAMEANIMVMSWDDILTNSTLNWVLDNTVLGYEIGQAAAHFINEHYSADNPAQVAIMNYPAVPILLERENGIVQALEEIAAGNFEIVARQPAIEAAPAMSHMETILQAHPDVRIVASIGAGGDIGANEAFMVATGGNIPDDMGIFSADATLMQLEAILDGQATRVTVGFEGSSYRTAREVTRIYEALLRGEDLPRNMVRVKTPMDINNAAQFLADYQ
jgi:ribose transport system substrate-binding protein